MSQKMDESARKVLPFYLVADESGSMGGAPIDSLNDALPGLHAAVTTDPFLADIARFGIIGFSDDASVIFPLTDLANVTGFPKLFPRALTNFGSAFKLIRETIDQDIANLKSEGVQPHRPLVFFFSDGEPTDMGWEKELQHLHDPSWNYHPNVVSFGLGDANPTVMKQIATIQAYIQNQDGYQDPGAAITSMVNAVTQSVVSSAASIRDGQGPQVLLPQSVPGYTAVSAEPL